MSTQQNIKLNNVRSIDARLYNDEYYDFMLYKGEVYGEDNYSDNVIADFSCPFDMEDNVLYSSKIWADAKNDGALLEDIGFTGPDNGFISFRKDRISNQDFLDILTGSTYSLNSGDTRLFLSPVTGNTLDYDYPMSIEKDDDDCYIAFKGGFYQGFYKLHKFDYQVLPNGPDYEWNLYFKIRPRTDYEVSDRTINHTHPENSGMFFYMGTRAENKFWSLYKTDEEVTDKMKRIPDDDNYTNAGMCGEEADADFNKINVVHEDYLQDEPEEIPESYFEDDYTISASTPDCPCAAQVLAEEQNKKENYYFEDGYLVEDDKYIIPMGKYDCKGHKAPGGDLSSYCEMNSSIYNKKSSGKQSYNCLANSDLVFTISDIYEYKYKEDSSCCTDSPCGCSSKSCNSKNNCCCDADYKEPCDCDEFFQDDYYNDECGEGPKAIDSEYLGKDADINEEDIQDSFGHEILKKGYFEIESDNKFLMFDRTKYGFTTQTWEEGTTVVLTGRTDWKNINYFPIMNRTKTGYTVNNIDKYQEENSISYNIYKDIRNNTFGLRITENGAIGYRYGVLDCDSEEGNYSVKEEYSKDGLIKNDEWNDVVVKIVVLNPTNNKCGKRKSQNTRMKLFIYVNGFLVLVSKEIPGFNFRELNDTYQKQEAVPYNISLGGGTQGLLEAILPDYYSYNEYILPIEKSFCGSFIGDIKTFKIINGNLNYSTIKRL